MVDYNIGNPTINRFFSLHYLLPFILIALTIGHLMTLHQVGGSNPLGISNITSKTFINFNPYYTFKDILGFILSIIIIINICILFSYIY